MLKVNSRSSANGGSGSTIIARIITTTSGAISARIALAFGPSQAWICCSSGFIEVPISVPRPGRRAGRARRARSSAGSAPGIGAWPLSAARSW